MGGNELSRVDPESGLSDFFEARLAGLRAPVRVEYSAIRDLRAGFDGNGERMGLLLGSSSARAVSVRRCELLALSPATLGDPKALQGALHQFIRARLQTPLEDAPELLGCFRTHTKGWSGISDGDLNIAKRSFPGLNPLFLLIQTTQHRPWLAALYALDAKMTKAPGAPGLEFPFDEYLLRNGYLTELVEATEPVPMPVQPAPAQENKTRWIIGAALCAILLGGFVAAYKWYGPAGRSEVVGRNVSGSAPLSLKVNRNGKDFEVSWDRLSAVLQQASGGTLTISDGALTRSVALSGAQLREGRILYTPLFEELTFRLEVANPDLGAAAESVQVLAWTGKQAADTLTIAPPDPLTNSPARIIAGDATRLPPRAPETKLPGLLPVIPKFESLKSADSKRDSGTNAPSAAAKSAPATVANTEKQPQPAKSAPVPETVAVIQPASPNPAQKQEIAPAAPARVPETTPPAAVSERPPAERPSPPPANPPPSQPAAPAPKPEPAPIRQNTPAPTPAPTPTPAAVPSLPPATAVPTTAAGATPAPVAAPPPLSGAVVLPVPIQRVPPTLPRNITAGGTVGEPRVVSVRAMVDTAGNVQSAEVVSSSPKGAFGEVYVKRAALEAAKLWKFRPGQLNGKSVAAEYIIDFKFQ